MELDHKRISEFTIYHLKRIIPYTVLLHFLDEFFLKNKIKPEHKINGVEKWNPFSNYNWFNAKRINDMKIGNGSGTSVYILPTSYSYLDSEYTKPWNTNQCIWVEKRLKAYLCIWKEMKGKWENPAYSLPFHTTLKPWDTLTWAFQWLFQASQPTTVEWYELENSSFLFASMHWQRAPEHLSQYTRDFQGDSVKENPRKTKFSSFVNKNLLEKKLRNYLRKKAKRSISSEA